MSGGIMEPVLLCVARPAGTVTRFSTAVLQGWRRTNWELGCSDPSCWASKPAGWPTSALVVQRIHQIESSWEAQTTGVIKLWEEEPTGAWPARGRKGKLGRSRLRLRKGDRELSRLTIDHLTLIYPLAVAKKQPRVVQENE